MRTAQINQHGIPAGILEELPEGAWQVSYRDDYTGPPLSFTLPVENKIRGFPTFPPVFEGLLPEGLQLEAILKQQKIDRHDYFALLMVVGGDLVGSLTFQLLHNNPENQADPEASEAPEKNDEGGDQA